MRRLTTARGDLAVSPGRGTAAQTVVHRRVTQEVDKKTAKVKKYGESCVKTGTKPGESATLSITINLRTLIIPTAKRLP